MTVSLVNTKEYAGADGAVSALARRTAEQLSSFRALMMKRVHEVNTMTAREVMAAVGSISQVVDCASAHVKRVKEALNKVDSGQGQLGIAEAIAQQSKTLRVFLAAVSDDIARQESVAARAQDHLQRIAKASRDTGRLASSAKLLAVNARIEAARVGGNGNCFSTIASEMQHLAEQITQANEFIDGLATLLSQDLPEVAVSAESLRELCTGLGADLSVTSTRVHGEVEELQTAIREALGNSDAELESMVSSSMQALSHLQFQDVVAQGLGRMEQSLVDLQRQLADEHNLTDIIPDSEHSEMGGEKDVDQSNAGEVLLF